MPSWRWVKSPEEVKGLPELSPVGLPPPGPEPGGLAPPLGGLAWARQHARSGDPPPDPLGSGAEMAAWRGRVGQRNGFSSSGAPAALLTQSPILMRNLERAWETRREAHRCGTGGAARGRALGRAHL